MKANDSEKQGLLNDQAGSEDPSDASSSRSYSDNRRSRPLRDLLKSVVTICWVVLVIYAVIKYFNSEKIYWQIKVMSKISNCNLMSTRKPIGTDSGPHPASPISTSHLPNPGMCPRGIRNSIQS